MQHSELMDVLVQGLDPLMGDFVVTDVQLFKSERDSAEHLLQAIVSDVVVNQIENFHSRSKVF